MSFDVLILLFILFSAASSIYKKIQERASRPDDLPARPRLDELPLEEEDDELDLSEWDVFREPSPQPAQRTVASPLPTLSQEFREIRGTREVEEPKGHLEEFQEIRGTRPVEEPGKTQEFREVHGTRRVVEVPGELVITREVKRPRAQLKKRRRNTRTRLRLTPQSVREGIVFSEILGPPRADGMPW